MQKSFVNSTPEGPIEYRYYMEHTVSQTKNNIIHLRLDANVQNSFKFPISLTIKFQKV